MCGLDLPDSLRFCHDVIHPSEHLRATELGAIEQEHKRWIDAF